MSKMPNLKETLPRFENTLSFAEQMDKDDPLAQFREQFHMPKSLTGEDQLYFTGNSLGLQPIKVKEYIAEELADWAFLGVEGHLQAKTPWLPYHEFLTESTARLVGAKPNEVVVMNTLTVNLHLMLVSFYRPTKDRFKILIEGNAFPSDQYAVQSQATFHGYNHHKAIIEQCPKAGEYILRTEDILETIETRGSEIALILLGQCNYLSGQAFDIPAIVKAAHKKDIPVGLNLAHGAGNLLLNLHDWDVDFAVWCSYKYLNAGPGAIAGCFIHEKHGNKKQLPRFAGWWGHNKQTRFEMGPEFEAIPGAEGWQLSNPPIFQLAALRASMDVFDQAGMPALRKKSELLTGYLEYLLNQLPNDFVTIITPKDPQARGCQLSFKVNTDAPTMLEELKLSGAICDFRQPDILRAAPAPLYNSFADVYKFAQLLERKANSPEVKTQK